MMMMAVMMVMKMEIAKKMERYVWPLARGFSYQEPMGEPPPPLLFAVTKILDQEYLRFCIQGLKALL